MLSSLCLLGCLLAPGQSPTPSPTATPPGRADWVVRPQLTAGQEFVYSGNYKEEAAGSVQYSRGYRLETRVLVLDPPRPAIPVALFTVFRSRDSRPGSQANVGNDGPVSSVRLERGTLGERGLLKLESGVGLTVPLDGPPALEVGLFLEVPGERLVQNQSWVVAEPGRPVRTWRIVGSEMVNGASCIKIVGEQQTDDWERPGRDRNAWRRQDTVWLAPRAGIAYKVERFIEKRGPGRDEPILRSLLRYELESSVPYTGQFFDERRQEVTQALAFAATAAPLLPAPARNVPQLNALANKIASHLDREPPTPYREAVLQVRRTVEAGKRGEVPLLVPTETPVDISVATVGEPAPDFLAPEVGTRGTTTLKRWQGQPVLLVFFNPNSTTADPLLQFAERLARAFPKQITVLGMAMSDDSERVREKTHHLTLSFPLYNGTGLRRSYAIDATPKMVVLDGAGVVRGSYFGWGNEIPLEVAEELKRWLPRK